ncbi:MAG: hypothetical protein DRI34_09875 [Deltaproteobacteria bacterium]|nr:MAG: hypothetical protein DRI34_09875 [Deltaproteobacteria bacterium]
MKKLFLAALLVSLLSLPALPGCGSECGGICGSQCDIIDCSYNAIKCDLYPGSGIVVHYVTELEGGGQNWTARLFFDTTGLQQVAGARFEGDELLNRVQLSRPGTAEQWPEFDGTECHLDNGGDAPGDFSGQCNFHFVNGYLATFNFSCQLQEINPD